MPRKTLQPVSGQSLTSREPRVRGQAKASNAAQAAIAGDIVGAAHVTICKKGGATTAIVKKAISDKLGKFGDQLPTSVLEFGFGQPGILIARSSTISQAVRPIVVHQVAANRFERELATGITEDVDDVTAAFLLLKHDHRFSGFRVIDPGLLGTLQVTAIEAGTGPVGRRSSASDRPGCAVRLQKLPRRLC